MRCGVTPSPLNLLHHSWAATVAPCPGHRRPSWQCQSSPVFSLFQDVGKILSRYETGLVSLSSCAAPLGRGLAVLQELGGRWFALLSI